LILTAILNKIFFGNGRDVVIERDIKEGSGIISSGLTEDIWNKLLKISRDYDFVYASIGLDAIFTELSDLYVNEINQVFSEIVLIKNP
jgi:hypothetical protein